MAETFNYLGMKYTQGKSKQQLLTFCASANDIRAWGGIPTKTERFHGGFQRALTNRYQGIVKFFENEQTSPTSIVVAFRQDALAVTELGYPSSWISIAKLTEKPQFVHVSFKVDDYDLDTADLETLRTEVRKMLAPRLDASPDAPSNTTPAEEAESAGTEPPDESDLAEPEEDELSVLADSSDQAGEGTTTVEDDEEDLEIDIGQSKLREFYEFLGDTDRLKTWLESENAKYEKIKAAKPKGSAERDFVAYTPEERLKSSLVSLLRPAMIVDGQHRVSGAYHSAAAPITFTVCAIKDADWIEQVFQFVVLNKLAKPISASFLTSLLNTSLTNDELAKIEPRLSMVDIDNIDRQLMKSLNYTEGSPFAGMISQPGEIVGVDNQGTLSDKGMLRVAKRWYNLHSNPSQARMFYPALGEKTAAKAKNKWQKQEVWTQYFYGFWDTIRDKYLKEGIWEKKEKYHLLYIVTLYTLQDLFLTKKAEGDAEFKDLKDFKDQVERFFEKVPATFFQNWEATGLQSGTGPKYIAEAVMNLREGTKLAKVRDTSPLFIPAKRG